MSLELRGNLLDGDKFHYMVIPFLTTREGRGNRRALAYRVFFCLLFRQGCRSGKASEILLKQVRQGYAVPIATRGSRFFYTHCTGDSILSRTHEQGGGCKNGEVLAI